MPRMNVSVIRQATGEDLRLLQAVELGMKNHELVGEPLVTALAKVRLHGANKRLRSLVQRGLLAYVKQTRREGYRLTFFGYDCLALNALFHQGAVGSVGSMIGTGKESDIYLAKSKDEQELVIKFTRLGRSSFRQLRVKRDYHARRSHISWLYLSRISAAKEHAFMEALHCRRFPVPCPVGVNRHCIVMEYIDGVPLAHVITVQNVQVLYDQLISFAVKLAECGLIHCDFNEFNIMVTSEGDPVVIDFPQAVSTNHPNAELYFDRDVEAVARFFANRFNYYSQVPLPDLKEIKRKCDLDVSLKASGFKGLLESDSEEEDVAENGDSASTSDDGADPDEDLSADSESEKDEERDRSEEDDSLPVIERGMDNVHFDDKSPLGDIDSLRADPPSRHGIDYEKIRRIVKNDLARKKRKREIHSAKNECTRRNATKGVEKNLKKDAEAFFG